MATLRNKRKLAEVSRETLENTRNSQSQYTVNPGMAEEYFAQVSEEIQGRLTKKLSKEFSRTESRVLGALSKLDELPLNPQFGLFPHLFREYPGTTVQEIGNPLGIVP